MTDLVTFLLAHLDADEAAARAATPGPWEAWRRHTSDGFMGDTFGVCSEDAGDVDDDIVSDPGLLPADAEHIARHDPARVLAEVAAKRAIVDLHRATLGEGAYCAECDDHQQFPCRTLRALASVYEGAPGWQEEWR